MEEYLNTDVLKKDIIATLIIKFNGNAEERGGNCLNPTIIRFPESEDLMHISIHNDTHNVNLELRCVYNLAERKNPESAFYVFHRHIYSLFYDLRSFRTNDLPCSSLNIYFNRLNPEMRGKLAYSLRLDRQTEAPHRMLETDSVDSAFIAKLMFNSLRFYSVLYGDAIKKTNQAIKEVLEERKSSLDRKKCLYPINFLLQERN
jgi:hypothetical protein